jgi:hypothetical protein
MANAWDVYCVGGLLLVVLSVDGERARCANAKTGRVTWIQTERLAREYDKAGTLKAARAKRSLAALEKEARVRKGRAQLNRLLEEKGGPS